MSVLGSMLSISAMGRKLYWMVGREDSILASVHCVCVIVCVCECVCVHKSYIQLTSSISLSSFKLIS